MPPLAELTPYLERIWDNRVLTNGGPLHNELEQSMQEYLGVKHVTLFANGTLALLAVLKALGLNGEVITTPYSFVATTHALSWLGLTPVFADIDPETLNLDPNCVVKAISERTTAILPVHCYGTPCDTAALNSIAELHGVRVTYDAAHAFGVSMFGKSILRSGDASVLSLHATKVFTTGEGGAVICDDDDLHSRICKIKNFGYVDETTVAEIGINAKLPELSSALGLLQLRYVSSATDRRKYIDQVYRSTLSGMDGLRCLSILDGCSPNYGYFPVLIDSSFGLSRDELYHFLRDKGIYARRYFYPLISQMPMYSGLPSSMSSNLPVATRTSNQIICLPIYHAMTDDEQERVVSAIWEASGTRR